ncbi:peptidase domain-containing ABC transporter [Bacillus sp. CLL-7-23]|uniref:Peptidase domain-containing ABC transporter n=1 Tax=Bacillus changyiensis TaxID=3004103 RepID=A0ABT4X4G1_9BACI|nr:peptidase domain-containing ABC transporter [Bacillus changyiensis]MDA7027083.1 peptidase domain-containing ABC transporter [Bacillus changyiensis]
MKFKKITHKIQHTDYDCGAACVAMVLKHYNIDYNFNDLKYKLGTDVNGTQLLSIYETLNWFEFKSKVYRIKEKVETVLNHITLPCIALLNNENENHYVVIHKVTHKSILVSDPLISKVKKEKMESFIGKFSGFILIAEPQKIHYFKKSKQKESSYLSKFVNFLKTEKIFLILTFFLSLLLTVFGVSTSFFSGILIDGILPHNLDSVLYIFALLFIFFAFFQALFQFLRDKLIIKMSIKLEKKLTTRYFNHLLKIPVFQTRNKEIGEFISRFNDVLTISQTFSYTLIATLVDFLLIFISGYLMFHVSYQLFLLTIVPVLLYLVICYLFFDNIGNKNRKVMESKANVNSFFIQTLSGIENVKALNIEKRISTLNDSKFNIYMNKLLELQNTNNISQFLKNIIQYVFPVVILWIGGNLVLSSQLTIGKLVTFLSLSAFFFTSVQNIANIQAEIQQSFIAADRVLDVLTSNIVEDIKSGQKIKGKINSIRFRDLSFSYKNRPIFDGISFEIGKNETVSFIGESGCGKSTLAKLLIKFLETKKGEIYINNINIKDINIKSLREKICYINDKHFFIPGTVRENLTLGGSFSDDEIIKACEVACIHDYINKLNKEYNHILLEGTSNFSLGQAQRLSIARAVLHKPDVLILDEVLSNVDEENAIKIVENLKNIDIITIFINHNSYLFGYYDKVFDFSKKKEVTL